ncbi:MAG: ketoacyl-ACP synthase III [Chitinophagales bacterium]
MAFVSIPNVKITGMAAVIPDKIVSNHDYDFITEKEREAIISSTGIINRRFAKNGICTSDLGIFGAEKLITELNWNKNEIELLIFVSQTRDYILPNTACIIQHKLGLSKNCMAFDIPLGCSGYTYGLSVAGSLMTNGNIKKAILIVGDVSSYELSYKDKSIYPLFGDAVSVTALEYSGNAADKMHFHLQTDGNGYEAIIIPDGGIRNPVTTHSFELKNYSDGIWRTNNNLSLDGLKVFEFTIREVAKNIKQLLNNINKETDDFDYYVFHQANLLMNETVRKQLKLAAEKVPYTLQKYGNTSSGSIPLTLVSELNNQLNNESHNYILSGFGVGLSWASVAVNLDKIVCPPVYEFTTE